MPKQTQIRPNSRAQVNDQQTFRYTTPDLKTVARPVDTYVKPQMSPNAEALIGALNQAAKSLGEVRKYKQERDAKQGEVDALSGKEKQGESILTTDAYAEAYYFYKGKAEAGKLRQELQGLYDSNPEMTHEEWQGSVSELQKKYLADKSDSYIRGFAPSALEIEDRYTQEFLKRQSDQVNNELDTNIAASAREDLGDLFDKDPVAFKQGARAYLDELHKTGKYIRRDKTQLSTAVLSGIGQLAADTGNPELLSFAWEKDGSGVALVDNPELQPVIAKWVNAAESTRNANLALQKEARKNAQDGIERQMAVILDGIKDVDASVIPMLDGLRDQIEAEALNPESILDPTWLKTTLEDIRTLKDFDGYGDFTDPEIYNDMYAQAATGDLDRDTLRANRRFLAPKDYMEIFKVQAREHAEARSGSSTKTLFENYRKNCLKMAAKMNSLGEFLDPQAGPRMYSEADTRFRQQYSFFIRENGRQPNVKEFNELAVQVAEEVQKEFNPLMEGSDTKPVVKPTITRGAVEERLKNLSGGSE
jgi:hypothetical protein